ncbi:MAG: DegQ family serine endoprotease [Kiritimatiellae bacterium]|nr:DegQ family serine endoprotease [Kiritimatiellia bacterium]
MSHHHKNIAVWSSMLILTVSMGFMSQETRAEENHVQILKETGSAFTTIAKKAIAAVVFIEVEKDVASGMSGHHGTYNNPFEFFGEEFFERYFGQPHPPRQPRHYRQMGQGSGFLISKDGDILTNNHVVGDADRITVTLHDGRKFQAEKVGSDAKSEVAVIRIKGDDFPFLTLGDSDVLEIGEWVIAVGNPFGLTETVTAGIVSAKGRSNIGIADYENFIQTDAAINPGNSGGPLLNIRGEVIGVNTAIYSQSGGYMGIGFAIPINMARSIKDQLLTNGKVVRGYLGVYIQTVDKDMASSFGLDAAEGILISQVMEDSAAEKSGLKEGDIITHVDGKKVKETGTFRNSIAALSPGTEVKLTLFRDRKKKTIKAVTGELPGEEPEATETAADTTEKIGLSVTELTPEIARQLRLDQETKGVLITEVKLGGAAWNAGLRQGMLVTSVNRQNIDTLESFNQALADASDAEVILLKITDGRGSRYVTVRVTE